MAKEIANGYTRVDDGSFDEERVESPDFKSSLSILRGYRLKRMDYIKPSRQRYPPLFSSPYMKIIEDVILFALAFLGLFSIFQRLAHTHDLRLNQQFLEGCDCGESVAEAVSRGCKFDSLAMAWLPEHCRDDELTAEFNTAGNGPNGTWIYYADTLHTIEVDPKEVELMGDTPSALVHMNEHWHTIHCIFYWRKQFRARFNGKIVEPRSDSEGHIKHCGHIFQKPGYGTKSGVALNTNDE